MQRLRLITLAVTSLLLLGLAGIGCATGGRFVQRAIICYNAADYGCAMANFQQIDASGAQLNEKGRVRYLTYRGLTHFRTGQMDLARQFLTQGNGAYRAGNPTWLPPEAVAQMNQALAQLSGGAPPASPEPPPTPAEPATIQ